MDPTRGRADTSTVPMTSSARRHATRERILLVGSNGGMLHAIHAGKRRRGTSTSPLDDVYDLGTGQELWAFIPPDLLPKLGLMVNGHEYFVDGTPMVRDIWADGSASGGRQEVKEADEFHTLAILTERSGGQRFVALDMTDPREMLKPDGKPFRWMFPNACEPGVGQHGPVVDQLRAQAAAHRPGAPRGRTTRGAGRSAGWPCSTAATARTCREAAACTCWMRGRASKLWSAEAAWPVRLRRCATTTRCSTR